LEPSLDSATFSAGSGIGAKLSKWDEHYSLMIAANQPEYGAKIKRPETKNNSPTGDDITISRSDRWHITSRGTYTPYLNLAEHKVFQIGASAYYKDNSNQGITFSTKPEAKARHTIATLTTDNASNLAQHTKYISSKYHIMYALEISGQNGSWHTEAEYQIARVRRSTNAGRDLKFKGWHVQATYILTGEPRSYNQDSGTFGKIIPQAASGAWEVAARYSYINLNSKDIRGGIGNNITLGINYYANQNIRVAANYIKSKQKQNVANKNLNIFGARLQILF
jgi:phosphate-selective porin OprO/OprP